ncbi:hypothetical protein [Nocardioides sp.]|uniref:hypothetical protein n=1 Tax=Nocardioides sp. TaxID=35761 RepID=UPI00260B1702|nr:hypothetical protein [Nocardioides sp.]MCW2736281.1 hypothetical protein [Nocardioides sp.]
MTTPDDTAPETHADPQTHLDTDPVNDPETDLAGTPGNPDNPDKDSEDDPGRL